MGSLARARGRGVASKRILVGAVVLQPPLRLSRS